MGIPWILQLQGHRTIPLIPVCGRVQHIRPIPLNSTCCEATFLAVGEGLSQQPGPRKNPVSSLCAFPRTAASQAGLRLILPEQPRRSRLATGQPS